MIIDRLLGSGVKLWLRSQLTGIERLEVAIRGKDRQIMTGYIPEIFIAADAAIYQDIALSQAEVKGVNIRFNLKEVIKAKPFQLLEPISVTTKVLIKESDLQASLESSLLSEGLTSFWRDLLQKTNHSTAEELQNSSIVWQEFSLTPEKLELTGTIEDNNSQITIITGLSLLNPQTLLFSSVTILGVPELAQNPVSELAINLGNEVRIAELKLEENQLSLRGTITVLPSV
ncbi:MAG: DUF2993 domain-containing protein [Xenococcaceae cyanobacterium MO_188.B19]|nr:DUF2993 domain-containing protein [Xenococcaceae cyanobacterium MO_188.B19]MDJ0682555.1 DUF2993 domain-containing protein [Xenococcaceae cyanobacterium MO_167.B52]